MDKNVEELQNELKVLKNEIKETLTDIREHLLTNVENPFPVELARQGPPRPGAERPAAAPAEDDAVAGVAGPQVIAAGQGAAPVVALGGPGVTAPGDNGSSQVQEVGPPAGPPQAREVADGRDRPAARSRPAAREREASNPVAEAVSGMAPDDDAWSDGKGSPAPEPGEAEEMTVLQSEGQAPGRASEAATDLVTVAMLASWVEDGTHRIGRKRLKAIVELYGSMGSLSPQLKGVLLQLIGLDGSDGAAGKVPLRECLRVLADLDNLVLRSRFDRSGAALLSLLLNGRDATYSR